MSNMLRWMKVIAAILIAVLFAGVVTISVPRFSRAASSPSRLKGHVPQKRLNGATKLGKLERNKYLSLAMGVTLRNKSELAELLRQLYDPEAPLYGQFLDPAEFAWYFSATEEEYETLAEYAKSKGLRVTGKHKNRLLLNIEGTAEEVEKAFNISLDRYVAQDGREFYAPDDDPEIPSMLISSISGIAGLDNAVVWRSYQQGVHSKLATLSTNQIGNGPGGGLTPSDIVVAYNLNNVSATGTGQTLAVFALDGYDPSDVATYASYYGLPSIPLENVLVNGASGVPGSGADEVTLDIELQMAMAPGASRIIVYEGPNSATGVLNTYSRIANDNSAKQISTSWGISETSLTTSFFNSESAIFQQMAAQGQAIFAASGDRGAYDNGSTLSVDDPASQPYVCGVGGTTLSVNPGMTYLSESGWNFNNTIAGGAGGGGISAVWTIPSWQSSAVTTASKGSTAKRNVPDVSLNADQNTGYSIFFQGQWYVYGGTSCAAPLWAGFVARVNESRSGAGRTPIGFINPTLYQIAKGTNYSLDFHDIKDGSTNLYYPAVTGYDLCTGWGSLNGANLMTDLVAAASQLAVPVAPKNLVATAGNALVTLSWYPSGGATSYQIFRGTSAGRESTTAIATGITATTYTNTGLTNGTTYYYYVKVMNSAGLSTASNEASAKPMLPLPATPANLKAAGYNACVLLSWEPAAAAASYSVFRGTAPGMESTTAIKTGLTTTTFTNTSLTNGTTYYFMIKAVNASGTSAASNEASAQPTLVVPPAPADLKVTPAHTAATLAWTASVTATSYSIYRGTSAGGESMTPIATGVTSATYTNSSLTPGQTYYYYVRAVNSAGASAPSTEISTTPGLFITAGPAATPGKTSATIAWTTSIGSTSKVSYGTSPTSLGKSVSNTTLVTAHTTSLSSLTSNVTYYYTVSSTSGITVTSPVLSFKTTQ